MVQKTVFTMDEFNKKCHGVQNFISDSSWFLTTDKAISYKKNSINIHLKWWGIHFTVVFTFCITSTATGMQISSTHHRVYLTLTNWQIRTWTGILYEFNFVRNRLQCSKLLQTFSEAHRSSILACHSFLRWFARLLGTSSCCYRTIPKYV